MARTHWNSHRYFHPSLRTAEPATGVHEEERRQRKTGLTSLILHLHPATVPAPALRFTYTWGLGGMSVVLVLLLALTGVLLMFRYDADTERAYQTILALETQTSLGSLVRGIHHWSANLLVVTVFLHLVRVFLTGGFKGQRWMNWLAGLGLLVVVMAANFTGYLLPWDQLAYWAVTVSTSLLGYIPVIGSEIGRILMGGPEVGQAALRNFYAFHVAVIPVILIAALSYHFWKVRKSGGISQPAATSGEKVERLATIPHLVNVEVAAGAVVIAIVILWGMLQPAPLAEMANPMNSPNPAKAAWYFLGLQELLLHMDALAAIALVGIILVGLALLPAWDRSQGSVGVYFRSRTGRQAAVLGAILSLDIIPVLIILDEFVFNLSDLLPNLPVFITTAILPLAASLLGLVLVYGLARLILKADHSEGLVALFSFIMISLVLLTITGVFFRGANMALVWPF